MAREQTGRNFRLQIPLDASGIENFRPEKPIKVLVQRRDGSTQEQIVKLDEKGQGTSTFTFEESPGALHVVVGPEDASAEELLGLQTLNLEVPARQWGEARELTLPAIRIPPYYWFWWLWWCRTFTIHGRVVCPDGSPVPGATVCADDIDCWWWWCTENRVGCATTDATGAFAITFRFCCGWWPWWWWRRRLWRLEPYLADRIMPVLQRDLAPRKLPIPSPSPSLAIFEGLLSERGILTQRPSTVVDPAALDDLRPRLLKQLPVVPELERLRIWPWWPWWPWWDCAPDIIFQVTQNCLGREQVILQEGYQDTRWDIPTTLNVTLVATENACCIHNPPPPEGNCMVIMAACSDPVSNIGGNPAAVGTPAGYANPGWVAPLGDRPYAGVVPISGVFGDAAGVDYYEFEWSTSSLGPWNPMPPPSAGGLSRSFWGPALPAGPVGIHPALFPFTMISGRNVVESREHFEATNGPGTWGLTRFWVSNRDLLMNWLTENNFADGTYYLQVVSWNLVGASLVNRRILPLCDTKDDNRLVLTLDNRITPGPGSGHPLGPPHPCGPGTVHICTTEPDTDFLQVRINGVPAGPCAIVDATGGGTLDIDFLAHDPDGHLAYYTLQATYGLNLAVDLLAVPGATLTPGPTAGAVPPASQVGPTYAAALTLPQTAVAPNWIGGTVRLHIPSLRDAFPVTCCYQLELRAYKRTIVSCTSDYANLSEYSLTVMV